MFRARLAYINVLMDSSVLESDGLMHAIMRVRELPPNEFCNNRVIFESRNGTCEPDVGVWGGEEVQEEEKEDQEQEREREEVVVERSAERDRERERDRETERHREREMRRGGEIDARPRG